MNVLYYDDPIPHVIIDDYFSFDELNGVWKELNFLTNSKVFLPPDKTGGAKDGAGDYLKKNSGLFLDYLFANNRDASYILTHIKKNFDISFVDYVSSKHFVFKYLQTASKDMSLLSYYENSDYYKPHTDASTLTSCIWLFKEPRQFTGGDFSFPDYNHTIQIKNNRAVIFPGIINHSVDPVVMKDQNNPPFSGNGRYVITQFIFNNG